MREFASVLRNDGGSRPPPPADPLNLGCMVQASVFSGVSHDPEETHCHRQPREGMATVHCIPMGLNASGDGQLTA